jgi:LysR family transcriptional regulator for metE and metH
MNASARRAPPVDSRHLRLLLAIVDQGGLGRAASGLHLSQSALSHQLRQIEATLGVPLFLRLKRRLVLTDAGRLVVERARPIVAELEALAEAVGHYTEGGRGRLRIATECHTCYEWLPPLLTRFHSRHPGIDVGIVAEATDNPIAALVAGDIDLAIVTRTPEAAAVELRPLFEDELLLVVPAGHRLAGARRVRPQDLADERLLLYTPPAENHFYRDFFSSGPHRPGRVDVIRLTEAVLSMVRAGLGVTVAAAWAIEPHLATGRLVGVRLGTRGFRRSWLGALRRPRNGSHPRYVEEFLRLLGESVRPVRHAARHANRLEVTR